MEDLESCFISEVPGNKFGTSPDFDFGFHFAFAFDFVGDVNNVSTLYSTVQLYLARAE